MSGCACFPLVELSRNELHTYRSGYEFEQWS
jgi:hypothetical protein